MVQSAIKNILDELVPSEIINDSIRHKSYNKILVLYNIIII